MPPAARRIKPVPDPPEETAAPPSWVVTVIYDKTRYDIDLDDLDGIEWRDATRAAGIPQRDLVREGFVNQDFGAAAALLWVWRRRTEVGLGYDEVLRSLNYRSLGVSGDEEKPADPPA